MDRQRRPLSPSGLSSYNNEGSPFSVGGKQEYLELAPQVKDLLLRQISSAVEDVLDSMMHEGTEDAHWRGKMRKDDVVYYEDRESVTKGQSRFCCVNVSEASVEEVVNLFLVSDTDMLLQRCRVMYDNIMDARILSVLEYPTEENPMRSSYIRYTAFKTPVLMRNHRDMCVVVATDVIRCPDGSTVGYCVWDSLNLPDVSEFDVPQGFIRSRMFRSGYFVQNTGEPNALTKVAYLVGIEAGGFAPRLATRYVMPRFGAVLNRVIAHLRRKQLDPASFAPQSEWTDKRTAQFCQCCSKHFGAVKLLDTRRYNCVVCGDAICHACHHAETVDVPGARYTTVAAMRGEAVALKIHDSPEDAEYQLQRKSATQSNDAGPTSSMLSRFGVGQLFNADRNSNQEQDMFVGSRVEQKYGAVPRSMTTTQAATCTASALSYLPSTYNINVCVSNNLYSVLLSLAASSSTCSLTDLLALESDTQLLNIVSLIEDIVTSPSDMSSLVYTYMTDTSSSDMDDFCSTFNTVISPCLLGLLPTLLPIFEQDLSCCAEVSDLIDLLDFFVPSNVTTNSFIMNELVNGVNQFFCSNIGDSTCGYNIFSQMTSTYTSSEFTLLESVVMPFVTMSSGEECTAMKGESYTDTASLTSATTINYSCCIDHMRPLIKSIQNGFEYFFDDTTVDILNGMIDFSASGGKFVDSVPGTSSCTFTDTCSDPSYLIAQQTATRTPGINDPGKNDIEDITCTVVDKCNSAGTVCSSVCEKGTASVSSWLNQTLSYQRDLAFSGKLCYAQIPATHNSAITLADGYGNRDQLFNANLNPTKSYSYLKTNNQVLSLTDQLGIGVRWLEIDTHYFLNDFHTGHCGNLGSNSIETFFSAFDGQLSKYGTILWGPELLGCFPSVSGIKTTDEITTRESMQEVMDWLKDNPMEFVFVYLDTGSDISRLNKYDDLNTLLSDVFGDLIVPQSVLKTLATGSWTSGSVSNFVEAGYRVLLLANDDTGLAYSLSDFCGGHEVLSTDYIDTLPDSSRKIDGLQIYGNDYFLRSYQAELRYISLSDEAELTNNFGTFLNSSNIGNFVRWNLNLVAPDMVDGAKMNAHAWSWAENEPSTTTSGAYVLMNTSGQWIASTSATKTYKACWSSSNLAWSVIDYANSCASGYTFSAPTDPYQNYLLYTVLTTKAITTASVVINATFA
ncbi:hypothetical protein BBO99_00005489 [Phytophthora kernoviae]|uniref:Uncharacterized protein n=2 Tax=Phytophthora kernoviae TaxID=325452 RepID=A0A3R7HW20_9STRA|nr:hypothetical protein G195_007471 [Phytophthora kernoviae 00238/432]KAG2520460.1 hypothetical protein JM16_006688 [Phytophthora kernoviae]RLN46034.1 hypothetical protein BBI17_005590 [Phytophthora kernoviae]RLN79128.1 hypothetical protein BBO99_00005489 [Phytophthora kernoviae]